ncbi:YHYH domain-containing protein [Cytobacillus kochii]|uniref:YHYH domain-containing protein n=1 Tax=Cytobacillus kochii TaxID=859143 RepID=UPI00399C7CD9
MKKISCLLVFLFLVNYSLNVVYAHPGRTDSNGGHTCRTNCEKWGLKYGEYHFHNGGGTSGSSSNNTNTSNNVSSTNKPAYTQRDVDQGRSEGKEEGYVDGYNRNEQSSRADKGNEGYKIGYKDGYTAGYAEGLKKIKDEDIEAGREVGNMEGKEAAVNGEENETTNNDGQSVDWNIAYKDAFNNAFKAEKLKIESKDKGYENGYSLKELNYPKNISSDEELKKIYKSQYETGKNERTKEEEEKNYELGFDKGYNLSNESIKEMDERFIGSYYNGVKEGEQKRKVEMKEEGYIGAFTYIIYEEPTHLETDQLIEWYKQGFDSNTIAAEIKDTAYKNGYESSNYYIPEEFKVNDQSIALYDKLFEEGQEDQRDETIKSFVKMGSVGVGLVGLSAGGLYINKRRKKKKEVI